MAEGESGGSIARDGYLRTGEKVGKRFLLGRLLGRGATADVFLAEDGEDGTEVAVKCLRPCTGIPHAPERLHREAAILSKLEHPNIAQVIASGEDAGVDYLVTRYVEGARSVDEFARGAQLDVDGCVSLVLEATLGVAHAHSHGIIHRDLKPNNILVDGLEVKVIDFGIARYSGASTLTSAGDVLGTKGYVSPELLVPGTEAAPQDDVYALGVILFELVVGCHPDSMTCLPGIPPDPRGGELALTPGLISVLRASLEPTRSRRIPDAEHLAWELERVSRGQPVQSQPVSRWRIAGAVLSSRRFAIAVSLLALFCSLFARSEYTKRRRGALRLDFEALLPTVVRAAENEGLLAVPVHDPLQEQQAPSGELLGKAERLADVLVEAESLGALSPLEAATAGALVGLIRFEHPIQTQADDLRLSLARVLQEQRESQELLADALRTVRGAYARAGRWEMTLSLAEEVVSSDHLVGSALSDMAYAYLNLQRPEEALAASRAAVLVSPDLAAAWGNLGTSLERVEDTVGAEAAYRRAIAIDPRKSALSNLAAVLGRRGDHAGALEILRCAPTSQQRGLVYWCNRGAAAALLKEWDEAEAAFLRALEEDPRYPEALEALGRLYGHTDRADAGLELLQQAICIDAARPGTWHSLAIIHRDAGRWEEALDAIEHAVSAGVESAQILVTRGAIHHDLGNLELTRECYERALELEPGSATVMRACAVQHIEDGELARARVLAEWMVDAHPLSALSWRTLGYALGRDGDHEESVEACSKSLELEPGNVDALLHRGVGYANLGHFRAASEDFEAMLDVSGISAGYKGQATSLLQQVRSLIEADDGSVGRSREEE